MIIRAELQESEMKITNGIKELGLRLYYLLLISL